MKKIIIVTFILVGVIVTYFAFTTFGGNNQEKKLHKQIQEIGVEFYEDFYYNQISANKSDAEITEFLDRFVDIGIKVDLDNLSRFNEEKYGDLANVFVNKKANILCDIHNSRVIIFPKTPFGRTDHKVDSNLDCGFDSLNDDQ